MRKTKLLIIFALLLASGSVKAQRLFFLFGHAEYASVLGDLKDTHNKGLGVEAGLGIGMNKTFFTGTIGYTWLQNRDNAGGEAAGTLRYSPVKLGVRRYVFRKNIFVKGDAGVANVKAEHGGDGTYFTAGLGAGVKFTGLEILGEYTTAGGGVGSWLSLKAGFTIGL